MSYRKSRYPKRKPIKIRRIRKRRNRIVKNVLKIIIPFLLLYCFFVFCIVLINGSDGNGNNTGNNIDSSVTIENSDRPNGDYIFDNEYNIGYRAYDRGSDHIDVSDYKGDHRDEILDYVIEISPDMKDGSLYMTYSIRWLVLDSDDDELTWVKVGIPNKYTEDIKALSDNIDSIYYIENSGDYVRIDFDDSYREGDVVEFSFSIHAHRLYTDSGAFRHYSYTPGWFEDIDVDRVMVIWDIHDNSKTSNIVCENTNIKEEDGMIFFTRSLEAGRRFEISIDLPEKDFEVSDSYNEELKDYSDDIGFLLIFIMLIAVLSLSLSSFIFEIKAIIWSMDAYIKGRSVKRMPRKTFSDYMKQYRRDHIMEYEKTLSNRRSGHYGSYSGGGGCACACACACAGGGRAGCSTKDFYGTMLDTKQIHRIIARS